MITPRRNHKVGVLNNMLYAVGGYDDQEMHNCVERYCPYTNSWTQVADMWIRRDGPLIGVVDGIMYVFGGSHEISEGKFLQSGEAYDPNTDMWSPMPDMLFVRDRAVMVTQGHLLYVLGGEVELSKALVFDTKTKVLSVLPDTMLASKRCFGGVVAEKIT